MAKYIIKRILWLIPICLGVIFIVFMIIIIVIIIFVIRVFKGVKNEIGIAKSRYEND